MKYEIFLLVAVSSILLLEAQAKPTNCSPGATFEVKCNICKCNTQGTDMLCTKKVCEDEYESTDNKVSNQESQTGGEKDSHKKENGEKVEKVQEESTKPEETSNKEQSVKGEEAKEQPKETLTNEVETKSILEDPEKCTPGQSYTNDCNTCTCPPSGLKSSGVCTLLACQ